MIKANFNSYNAYVTDSLYQWDINQVLSINGLNLDVVPEIHFNNKVMAHAIVKQAESVGGIIKVMIPNSLLQEPFDIIAYVGIYEAEVFKTIEKVEIPVLKKERPDDYKIEDTDAEIYSFKKIENEISNLRKMIEEIMKQKASREEG